MSSRRDPSWGVQLAANFSRAELEHEARRLSVPVFARTQDDLADAVADALNQRGELIGGKPLGREGEQPHEDPGEDITDTSLDGPLPEGTGIELSDWQPTIPPRAADSQSRGDS